MITFDDFKKVDLRVAKILEAEKVEGSEKLVKLKISVGELGERQLVAGIGTVYSPEILVGKQIIIVANLEPKKFILRLSSQPSRDAMAGTAGQVELESQGMLLAASDELGPVLLAPESDVKEGTEIR